MAKYIYFIYGLMLISSFVKCAQGRETINIFNLTCTSFDEKVVVFEICDLPKVGKTNLTSISVHVDLIQPVHNVTIHMYIHKMDSPKSPKLMEFKSDVCGFMKNKRRNPVARLMYSAFGFDKYSNMDHACPYVGKVYMQSPGFTEKMLNLMGLPKGRFLLTMKYLINHKTKVHVTVVFEKKELNN